MLAIDCAHDFFDEHSQEIDVFDVRTRVPVEAMYAYYADFGSPVGTEIYGPVLSGGHIVFESEYWRAGRKNQAYGTLRRETLVQVDGSRRHVLRSAHRLGTLEAGDRDWLAFQLKDGDAEITSPTGKPLRLLHLPALHLSPRALAPSYLLAGNELVRLGGGRLQAWHVGNGRTLIDERVFRTGRLQAVDGGLVVYSLGSDIHLFSGTRDRVIHTSARNSRALEYFGEPQLHAALTPAGLFYSYNTKDARFPGRVVFVPRSELPR